MGSGKSTVGALLAQKLQWQFVDLDSEIVVRVGRSIAEFFRDEGEAGFRATESRVLREVLQNTLVPAVLALGGGTFIAEQNRLLLREHGAVVVYLSAEFDQLFARCCDEQDARPLMADPARFRRLFEERQPVYKLADFTINAGQRAPQAMAEEIVEWMENRNSANAVPE